MNINTYTNLIGFDYTIDNPSIKIKRIGKGCNTGQPYKRFQFITNNDNKETFNYIDVFPISDLEWDSKDKCNHNCDLCLWTGSQHLCGRFVQQDIFDKL